MMMMPIPVVVVVDVVWRVSVLMKAAARTTTTADPLLLRPLHHPHA
jgi:hypothetical protein